MMQERSSESVMVAPTGRKSFLLSGTYYSDKCFPSLNDMLREAERHPKAYNKIKRDYEFIAINAIRRFLKGYKAEGKVIPHYTFGEPNKGQIRDYDNISAAARKIINDALVKTSTIKDDKPQYLEFGTSTFVYTDTPFIKVELEEVGKEQHGTFYNMPADGKG